MVAPCQDCRIETSIARGIGHYYTLNEHLWRQATPDGARFLCLDCLEARLGRKVREGDFVATPTEILARFAGEKGEPLPAAERQRELDAWRTADGFRAIVMRVAQAAEASSVGA